MMGEIFKRIEQFIDGWGWAMPGAVMILSVLIYVIVEALWSILR